MSTTNTAELKQAALPFAILAEEMGALERFHECANDGEGYDVPKEMMKRLAEIGLIRRVTGNYYEHTTFGLSVLNGDFAGRSAAQGEPSKVEKPNDFGAYMNAMLKSGSPVVVKAAHAIMDWYQGVDSQAGSAEQVSEQASQLEQWLDVDNHRLRRTMQKMMARLADLLDEDQFAEFESLVSASGVDPHAAIGSAPLDEWVDYAKRTGLLDENGVATDPHKTQTAWFAFTAAWNRCAALSAPERKVSEQEGGAKLNANPAQTRMDAGSGVVPNQQVEQTAPEGWIHDVAQYLYGLLDDIDTASDAAKSNNQYYRNMVEEIQAKKRNVVAECDGYTVKFKPAAAPSTAQKEESK